MSLDPDFMEQIEKSIEEFKNRRIYSELNQSIIAGIADNRLEQAVIDFIYEKIGEDYEQSFDIITGLPWVYPVVYSTWVLEGEVSNGGFNQYFWNSSGEFAEVAATGFKALGVPDRAEIVQKAIVIASNEFPEMKKFYEVGTLEAFSKSYEVSSLDELDAEFYECQGDLSEVRIRFIREHAPEFSID